MEDTKVMKTQKPKKRERPIDQDSTPNLDPLKPMERKKKRKALAKEKHKSLKPICGNTQDLIVLMEESDGGEDGDNGLPELHLGVFKDLGSGDAGVRVAAAERLVRELKEVQKVFEKSGGENGDGLMLEAEKDDGLNGCAPSVRYAVRRLIRGVSSSRECARQGFALGLTVLIGALPCVEVDSLMKLIIDLLEVSSSMRGQDVKDCLLGRLFAYGAIARSGRLTNESTSEKSYIFVKGFVSSLIALASKKQYLQEPLADKLLFVLLQLPIEAVLEHIIEAPGLREWFEKAPEVGNPDALLLALKMRVKISIDNEVFGKLLPNPYSSSKLFSTSHLLTIANCLKESTFCQPRVHNVWPTLLDILLPNVVLKDADTTSGSNVVKKHKKHRKSNSSEEDTEKNLRCFWETIIEESLLLSSHDRKHLAFDIFLLLLPRLPTSCVSIVLSSKFVQCLMDVLSTKTSWLYKVAQHFLKELSDWVEYDEVRRAAVIVSLQKHSNGKFDCITRTKTVKDFMAKFTTEAGCMLFIQNLMDMFLDEGHVIEEPSDHSQTTDDNSEIGSVEDKDSALTQGTSDFLKTWVIESLPSVLKHLKIDQEAKFGVQKEILKFLAVQGLFSSSLGTELTSFDLKEKFRWPKVPNSSTLCRMCIEQLQLLLKNSQKGEGPHPVVGGLEANDLGSYFMLFFKAVLQIPSLSLFRTLSNEDKKALENLQATEIHLCREERNCGLNTDARKLRSLRYLLIQLLLQVLLRPDEFIEAASELIICCKKAFPSPDLDLSGDDEPDSDGTPELMDVLVDTLLSLLPQSSAPMRSAIEQVFKYFCDGITDDGLLRMLRVIKKDLKPARHQDVDSEDDEEDDDDLLGIEEADESDEGETAETGNSDEESLDSEAVDGGQPIGKEISDVPDDSDSGMDDDAMFRMDSYLAQIFREKKNQAGGETAQSQLVLFKLRVLSLLEIYLHENPGKPQVVKVFSYLVQAFVNPNTTEGSEQLGQRILGILQKKIFKAKDHPRGEAVQLSMLESLLEKNLKLASKPFKKKKTVPNPSKKKQSASFNRYKMIKTLAQNSTFWILKVIDSRSFPKSELQRIFDIFKGVLGSYFDSKKSDLKCDFLKEIFRRPWLGHNLFGYLIKKCGNAKSKFRQVEALALVTEILKSLVSVNADGSSQDLSKKLLKSNMSKLCLLVKELMTNMPDKQAKRAEVRKFCGRVFQTLISLKLSASFLKSLEPEVHAACEAQLGETFLALKRQD
ncbi:rDNA transcriptional regulator pol5 [Apium graveolens]|uniref:rDNA transcriptional regulator pol5 n=1 Tax=Apium graveolens TaxID=4045 RepID=UPI003D7A6077